MIRLPLKTLKSEFNSWPGMFLSHGTMSYLIIVPINELGMVSQ